MGRSGVSYAAAGNRLAVSEQWTEWPVRKKAAVRTEVFTIEQRIRYQIEGLVPFYVME